MSTPVKEMIFLYFISEELYKKPVFFTKPFFSEVALDKLIKISMENNMFYYHIKKLLEVYKEELNDEIIKVFENIQKKGEEKLKCIKDTIYILNNCLENYLLVKTYRGYSRLPTDLDILVTDFENSFQLLKRKGFRNVNYNESLQEAMFIHDRLYKVHLHGKISWAGGIRLIDDELAFKNVRNVDYNGVMAKIPNFDVDFLIHIAHMNFEPLHITLSELLYLYKIASEINWDMQFAQSKKYNWCKSFIRILNILDKIYHALYENPCPFVTLKLDHNPPTDLKFIILPKSFSRMHLIKTCIEKKLFKYPLFKFSKSLKILLTGNTYKDYYLPVEYIIFEEDIKQILKLCNYPKRKY